jgi:hypothetical protein
MAYGLKYKMEFRPLYWENTAWKRIRIFKDGYVGAVETLKLAANSVSVSNDFDDWGQHIIGKTLEMDIVNNNSDYFHLLDLMYATEREYYIVIDNTGDNGANFSSYDFMGFINTELTTQKYLHNQIIHIVASSFVSKLEYITYSEIETLKVIPLMTIIADILKQTAGPDVDGAPSAIYVNCAMHPEDWTFPSQNNTLFDKCGLYTEMFWEDNVDRKMGYEILEIIFKALNCYLFWHDNAWYIEHIGDIWKTTKNYVMYAWDYNVQDASGQGIYQSAKLQPQKDISDLTFSGMTQTLSVMPGDRTIRVESEYQATGNNIVNDFPKAFSSGIVLPSLMHREISYSIGCFTPPTIITPYKVINSAIPKTGLQLNEMSGLGFGFRASFEEGAQLNLTFKYALSQTWIDWLKTSTGKTATDIKFRWALRGGSGNYWFAIVYNTSSSKWEYKTWTSRPSDSSQRNQTSVKIADMDFVNYVMQFEVNIPLDDVQGISLSPAGSGYWGNDWTFHICKEEIIVPGNNNNQFPGTGWFGDVIVSISGQEKEANIHEGTQNTKFLNKREIKLDIVDSWNANVKNAVYIPKYNFDLDQWDFRTKQWIVPSESAGSKSMVDWTLYFKFRLHNVSRQRITGEVVLLREDSIAWMKLFTAFIDSHQLNKKYILTSMRHLLQDDVVEVQFDEFDTTTAINLIG